MRQFSSVVCCCSKSSQFHRKYFHRMSDTVGSLRPSSFPSFELNRFHAEIGGRPTSNWPSKKKEKERVKLKKTPDLVFKGFGDDDDPFGDSKAEISEDELESRKKKRGKINVEYDMGKVEGFLNNELDQLKGKLGELRLGRPTVKSFNSGDWNVDVYCLLFDLLF